MSMARVAARPGRWPPRSRSILAMLAVSLVLNVLFVAGGVWSRVEVPKPPALDQRFERIGAQLNLDPVQQAAFDKFLADMRGRRTKLQRQLVPLYRAAWDTAARPAVDNDEVLRSFEAAFDERARLNRETTAQMVDFLQTLSPEQRGRFVKSARDSWRK